MSNRTTRAQRHNARLDKIWDEYVASRKRELSEISEPLTPKGQKTYDAGKLGRVTVPESEQTQVKMSDGYVVGVRCGKGHSGNDRLAGPTNGYFQCCGCGAFSAADHVANVQSGPIEGQKGQGGIYRAAIAQAGRAK